MSRYKKIRKAIKDLGLSPDSPISGKSSYTLASLVDTVMQEVLKQENPQAKFNPVAGKPVKIGDKIGFEEYVTLASKSQICQRCRIPLVKNGNEGVEYCPVCHRSAID